MSEKTKKKFAFPRFQPQDIITILFAVLIFYINFKIVGKCYNPFVYNDEMGYWTHAAEMAGLDWHGVSKTLAWYSFGYSFMLAPLMKIISDTVILYRAAIILNICMEIVSYFLFVYIIRYLFPKIGKLPTSFVSAAAILYTSYQMNAGIAFSETALLFVTTVIVFTVVRIIQKPTYLNLGCLGILSAYLFMIHNRTIGIVASAILIVALGFIFKKIDYKKVGVFTLTLVIGIVCNKLVRGYLESALWPSGKAGGNDAGSVFGKLKAAFSSVDAIKKLVSIMAAQGFAVSAATMCLVLFALWAVMRRIIAAVGKTTLALKEKKKLDCNIFDERIFVLVFIFCAFISTWMISSVFMFDFQRIDHVLYTRYFDIIVGVLVMVGICYLYEAEKIDFGFMLLIPFIMRIGAGRASVMMQYVKAPVFNKVCSPGICRLYEFNGQNFHAYITWSVSLFFLMAFIMYALKKHKLGIFAVSIICICCFNKNTPSAVEAITINQDAYADDRAMIDRNKEIFETGNVYMTPSVGTFASFLQYELNDVRVDFVYDLEELNENSYVFANKSDIVSFLDYNIIDNSDKHIIVSAVADEENSGNLPLSYMNTFDYSYYIADEDIIESNPANNYVCYGPYLNLDIGEYTFSLDMDFDKISGENIGFAEIRSSSVNTVYDHIEITDDMISKDGSLDIDLNANVGISISDMEIVVFLYEPTEISMQLNSIQVDTKE